MIVGTWASSPAPATSPQRSPIGAPLLSGVDGVLHIAVEVEAPGAALTADAGLARATERRPQVADEEAVHPHGPRDKAGRHPFRPGLVAGEHRRGQPVPGAVREFDRLV